MSKNPIRFPYMCMQCSVLVCT